jgi:hypothetical protein
MDRTPQSPPDSDRVLPFRPRRRDREAVEPKSSPVEDVGKYARTEAEPDDYAHRMRMNAAGVAIVAVLIIGGVWIANKMAEVRREQDCVLSGRRNCAPITVPIPAR